MASLFVSFFMKDFFLKIKHWQLFLLLFLPPLIMGGYFLLSYPSSVEIMAGTILDDFSLPSALQHFMCVLSLSFLLGECYMMALLFFLNDRLPENLKVNVVLPSFTFTFVLMCTYFVYVFLSAFFKEFPMFLMATTAIMFAFVFYSFLLIPLFLLTLPVAKVLITVELQRKARTKEFLPSAFLFLFFPVGVWFLQPSINRLGTDGALASPSLEEEKQESAVD